MKTKIFSFKKIVATFLTIGSFTIGGISSYAQASTSSPAQSTYTISGTATGAQVVPSVAGNGAGSITGTYDPSTHVLNYTTNWNNLTGAPSSAGFYTGASGVAGKPLGDPWAFGTNITPTGNITGNITLTDEQAKDLTDGNLYYSLGTATNTTGEIRGQIAAKKQ
ncbi:MAG: CHRD domain-containing protein [Chitinophagaceae bacterium]